MGLPMLAGMVSLTSQQTQLMQQTGALAVGTFVVGQIPLLFKLSQAKMRYFSLFGTGLLIGAALSIVIPEGIEAVYKQEEKMDGSDSDGHQHQEQSRWVALALIGGFLFMYLVDQLQSHVHTHPKTRPNDPEEHEDAKVIYKQRNHSLIFARRISTRQSTSCVESATPLLQPLPAPPLEAPDSNKGGDYFRTSSEIGIGRPPRSPRTESFGSSSSESGISVHAGAGARSLSTTIGLLVHSLADGISLGASSAYASSNRGDGTSLDVVVFMAIMVHKAPAAFGLVSVLVGDGWPKMKIRRALAAFALAAPVGAVLTYLLLQLLGGKDSAALQWYTGMALLVSGGTFLFVATHVMQETTDEKDEGWQKIVTTAIMVFGMLTPMSLQSIVGHAH